MATTPEYISYDGNPTNPNGLTPFAIFDSESLFQTDGPKVANFVATRLGYPIMDVELQDQQIYAGDYGTEALSGGPVELKRGYITASANTASYDLNALWATPSESGDPIEIRKVYHHGSPAISRYYDPFAATGLGITNLFAEFGFDDYSPAITFVMMPAYEDMLRVQAIEINDVIRKSIHSFTLSNNKLRITPIPTKTYAIFFDYYLKNEKSGSQVQSGGVNEFVSDASNVPMSHIKYANINSVGKVWIFKYTLALAKEVLGLIRSKYQSVPIPNQDIRMDGEVLRREAVQEKQELIKELQETLEKSGLHAQMKAQAEAAEHQGQILSKVPILPIYVK